MSPKQFIMRKFRVGWSDVQLIVLLQLAESGMLAYAELVRETGASETGVWNALTHAKERECVATFDVEGKNFYHLTETGVLTLKKLLK